MNGLQEEIEFLQKELSKLKEENFELCKQYETEKELNMTLKAKVSK